MNGNDNMQPLIIDCFAGGGGASVGIEMALGRHVDIAVNHDPAAIRMHKTNHPFTLHLTEDIFETDLQKYVNGRHAALMWASPDCTSHSRAKGGKPRDAGLRMLPWAVYKHAKAILPDVIIMENVEEIQQWGPLDSLGCPVKEKIGEEYQRFMGKMHSLGYESDSRVLTAADYGAPTTRRRWYAVLRRDGKPVVWPEPTHSRNGAGGLQKWVGACSVLDFSNPGKSIFGRNRPLAEKTMTRIAMGLRKFIFENEEPFIIQDSCSFFTEQSIRMPLLIQYHSETKNAEVRGQSVKEPLRTIDTSNRYGAVTAFFTKIYAGTLEPLHAAADGLWHSGRASILSADFDELIKAGVPEETAQKCTWASEFIMKYYGCGTGQTDGSPLHAITAKGRFALITVFGGKYAVLDIFLRMLTAEELKLAQGFPKDYIIDRDYMWNTCPVTERIKRIGNSVVPIMAEALVKANCGYLKTGERVPCPNVETEGSGQLRIVI